MTNAPPLCISLGVCHLGNRRVPALILLALKTRPDWTSAHRGPPRRTLTVIPLQSMAILGPWVVDSVEQYACLRCLAMHYQS